MAIEIISGENAWSKDNQRNKTRRWPSRRNPERLYPIATPEAKVSFKIKPDEKIFCIGSCFANEISQALYRQHYDVLSIFHDLPKSEDSPFNNDSVFHKYNVASIYNELAWALDPEQPYCHDQALISIGEDIVQDYQLTGKQRSYSRELGETFRDAFNRAFSAIREADVVILTLGVSEVWFDKDTQRYLNVAVPHSLIKTYPERFELHVFDYETTSFYLNAIYQLLATHLKPDFRLLVTVSPIPLTYTFRQQDVFISNSYSKAVLRVTVEELVASKANVNYFPSYEFVTLSNPSAIWRHDDYRHVDSSFVDYIMGNVMAQFTDATDADHDKNLLLKVKSLYYGGFIKDAKKLLSLIRKNQKTSSTEVFLLWTAMNTGLSGKVKLLFFKCSSYLKTYRHLSFVQHIDSVLSIFRKLSKDALVGHVDHWDGQCLNGWACNQNSSKPVQIKVLLGKAVIKTELAALARPDVARHLGLKNENFGFKVPLDSSQVEGQLIRVVFAESGDDLNFSPIYIDSKVTDL